MSSARSDSLQATRYSRPRIDTSSMAARSSKGDQPAASGNRCSSESRRNEAVAIFSDRARLCSCARASSRFSDSFSARSRWYSASNAASLCSSPASSASMGNYRRKISDPSTRRKRFVAHFENLELLDASRRLKGDCVAFACLGERARHRRYPADVAAIGVDLVDTDDAYGALLAVAVTHVHRGTKEYAVGVVVVTPGHRIDDFGLVESPDQESNAPVDFAQALLAVDVVAVFGAVAVAGRPRHHRDQCRAFFLDESVELRLEPHESARRYVVLRASRQGCVLDFGIVVDFGIVLARKGFVHDRL